MFIGRFCERFTAFPAKIKNARNRNKANILHHQNENSIPLALSNSELTKKRTILSSWLIDTTWRTFGALTSTFWRDNYSLLIMRKFYHIRTAPSTVFDQFLRNLHDFLPEKRVFACFLPCNWAFGRVCWLFFVFYRSKNAFYNATQHALQRNFAAKQNSCCHFMPQKPLPKRLSKFFSTDKQISGNFCKTEADCNHADYNHNKYTRTHVYARVRTHA